MEERKKYSAAMSNNSLTLNLILCQKRQLNPGRISLLKRKVQHRRKGIQRQKHGKVKTPRARKEYQQANILFIRCNIMR
jgi:hypothetical protein